MEDACETDMVETDAEEASDADDNEEERTPGAFPSADATPRSPCQRRASALYDLLPPEPSDTSSIDGHPPLEAQIVDVTYRDHEMPSSYDAEVDDAPKAFLIDMHLVDATGRTVLATVEGVRPRVRFVYVGDAGLSATKLQNLCAAAARCCRSDDADHAAGGAPEADEIEATAQKSRRASLVGFDPHGDDPLQRRTFEEVSLAFKTHWQASRVRRMHPGTLRQLGFVVVDPRCDPVVAFFIERRLEACGWVAIRRPRVVPPESRTSSAQLELVCAADNVAPSERRGLAPLLVASYDIETYGSRGAGVFPDADVDADYICAITTNFWRAGAPVAERFNVVMIVGHTTRHHGADTAVECYATERELLLAWSSLLRRLDPKVITGYNIYRFDNPYVSKRAHRLRERLFWHFGAHLAEPVQDKPFKLESAAYGSNEGHTFAAKGKVILDLMQYMQMNYKLPLYNLNFISGHFLGSQKTDLDIPTMWRLVEKGEFDPVIAYVQRDGELVQELLKNRDVINSVWEMSRATSTLPTDVLTRGQQIRVMNRLRRTCAERDVAIRPPPEAPKRRFIGARVVSPVRGFYDPTKGKVITLDFASLYPSIVRAYNLCYQTWIPPNQVEQVRARFPALEIVPHELELGQVWEELQGRVYPECVELTQQTAAFVDLAQKQFKKSYVDVALTDDEFEAVVVPMVPAGAKLGRHHFVTIPDASGRCAKRLRPKPVAHHFAKGVPCATSPTGEARCPSLLPEILEELGKLRKKAKKAMGAAEADAKAWEAKAEAAAADGKEHADRMAAAAVELAALYDKEQLAYKVVMNSVYGFTAADTLRLLALAETITALGRKSLGASIAIAERLCAEMGFPESRVVYGDTDSLFVHVAGASAEEALDVGARISSECNAHFERETKSSVLKLEFEALFEGLVLIGKKTYAGLQHAVYEKGTVATKTYGGREWTIEEHGMSAKPKKYKKGLRAVRRDTPPFVAELQSKSLDVLLDTKAVPPVLAYIEAELMRLVDLQVPRADFRITMQLKREEDYHRAEGEAVAKQPHLRLVKKLEARSVAGTLPQGCTLWGVGERVPYFYAETDELVACDRAECPVYGEVHGVPPDRVHYFELAKKALKQGLSVIPDVDELVMRIYQQLIAPLRKEVEKRRKHAEERRQLQRRGQTSITGFFSDAPQPSGRKPSSGARPTTSGKRPAELAPPRAKRHGTIHDFL